MGFPRAVFFRSVDVATFVIDRCDKRERPSVSTPATSIGSDTRPRRWQITLADLIVLVLAVGVSAGIARQARDAWGNRGPSPSSPVPVERTAGVVCEVAAVFLILYLTRTLIVFARVGRGPAVTLAASFIWSIVWRIGAIAILAAFVADESVVLRIDWARQAQIGASLPGWDRAFTVRQNLLPVYGTLAIVGLSLGIGAGALFDNPRPSSHRPYWLFVPLVGVIAVLLAATTVYSLIVYLVLQALEAVSNARNLAPHGGPGLAARLLGSGRDAAMALLACVALALVVARDFDRARRRLPWAKTPGGWFVRLLSLFIALLAGIYIVVVTIPAIHPSFGQGFVEVISPRILLLTVAGFGLFALGLAARAVAPGQPIDKPAWLCWLAALCRYGLLLVFWLSAMKHLPASSAIARATPSIVGRVIDVVGSCQAWAWGLLPYPVVVALNYCLEFEQLQWVLAAIFVSVVVIELTTTKTSTLAAPFDAIFGSVRSTLHVAWLASALTLVCLVALPTLVVAGQLVVHVQLNLEDWLKMGWPR
jgi:hypothetical protein